VEIRDGIGSVQLDWLIEQAVIQRGEGERRGEQCAPFWAGKGSSAPPCEPGYVKKMQLNLTNSISLP
jgi:hypothetical protein